MSRSQTDKRTHTAPHTRTPPPRLGGERDERMEQPEGGDTNTYGKRKGNGVTLPGSPGQPRPCEAGKWRLPRTPSLHFAADYSRLKFCKGV